MKSTVLIVDDESNVRCALLRLLRLEPYEIISASSAEDARHMLQRHRVDLIVTDNQLTGSCGIELLEWVRQVCPEIVRIMLTGRLSDEAATRALGDTTIHHLFTKPCNVAELSATIRRELEQGDRRGAACGPPCSTP